MDLPDRNVQIGQLRNDPRSLSSTYSCSQAANALALVDTLLRKKEASEHIDPGMEMQYLADIRSCLVDVVQRLNDGETILKQGREEEIPYDGPENNVQSQKCLSESMKLLSELNRNLESIATKMEKEELAKEAMNKKRGIKGSRLVGKEEQQVFSAQLTALRQLAANRDEVISKDYHALP